MNRYIYLPIVLCIALASFYFYAPFNHFDFNSDHAVHALMAQHFDWEHGTYYWGQNRLGSFLPWISSFPVRWFGWHPLYVTGTVNYIFLVGGYLLLARYLKTLWQRVLFACFIFWPLFAFNYLLLIGHPYGAQLFLLALSATTLQKTRLRFLAGAYNSMLWYYTWFFVFFSMACWVSELSGLFAVLFGLLALSDKEIRGELQFLWKKKKPILFSLVIYTGLLVFSGIKFYQWTKTQAPPHEDYDRIFITKAEEIRQQWNNMYDDVSFRVFHTDGDWRWTIFYYSLWMATLVLAVYSIIQRRKEKKGKTSLFPFSITLIAGCVVLFFSVWNYVTVFDLKYFTPLYVLWVFYLLYATQHIRIKAAYIILILCSVAPACALLDNKRVLSGNNFNPRKELTPFSQLPEGGLIGGYWLCYRVNAFAPYNLLAVPIQQDYVRNAHMVDEVFSRKRIYVIKNGFLPDSLPMPDTLLQHNRTLLKTGNDTTISSITFAPYKVIGIIKQ